MRLFHLYALHGVGLALADDEQLPIADNLGSLCFYLCLVNCRADRFARVEKLYLGEAAITARLVAFDSHEIIFVLTKGESDSFARFCRLCN